MEKIKKVSQRFRVLFQILLYLVPVCVLWYWIVLHTQYDIFSMWGIGEDFLSKPVTLNLLSRTLGFIVTLMPAGIMMYGLRQLIKLFKNYESGKIFVFDNVNFYRKLGYTLFVWVIGGIIYDALISLVVTFQNKPGYREVAIGFSSYDIVSLIAGGIIILIAWVMKEGYQLSEDQSLMI